MKTTLHILGAFAVLVILYILYKRYTATAAAPSVSNDAPVHASHSAAPSTGPDFTIQATATKIQRGPTAGQIFGAKITNELPMPDPPTAPQGPDFNALSEAAKLFLRDPKVTGSAYQTIYTYTWTGNKAPDETLRKEVDTYLQKLAKYYVDTKVAPGSFYIGFEAGWPKAKKTATLVETIRETTKQVITAELQEQKRALASSGYPGKHVNL